jgi:hypothetical protein
MRRGLLFAVLGLLVSTPGCGHKAHDAGCTRDYPKRITVPAELRLLVTACDARDGLSGTIKNESAGILALAAPDTLGTSWREITAPADSSDSVIRAVVSTSPRAFGSHWLYPRHTMLASSTTKQEPRITVQIDFEASAKAVAASYIAEWLRQIGTTPGQGLLGSLGACAGGIGDILAGTPRWEDVFRDAMSSVPACAEVVHGINGADGRVATEVADEVIGQSSKFGGLWEDFMKAAEVVAHIFPRA